MSKPTKKQNVSAFETFALADDGIVDKHRKTSEPTDEAVHYAKQFVDSNEK